MAERLTARSAKNNMVYLDQKLGHIVRNIPFDRLEQICQAEKLLGQIIYRTNCHEFFEWQIACYTAYVDEIVLFDDCDNQFVFADIGKTVFLDKAQAEAALAEVEGNE